MADIYHWIDKSLNTRVTPLAYLFVFIGFLRGFAYVFFQNAEGVKSTVLSQITPNSTLLPWGIMVLIASCLLFYGMLRRGTAFVIVGSFLMFFTWVLTAVAYYTHGYVYYLLPYAILSALAYGYFAVAAAMDRLWDYAPGKR